MGRLPIGARRPGTYKKIVIKNVSTNELREFSNVKDMAVCIEAHTVSCRYLISGEYITLKGWMLVSVEKW